MSEECSCITVTVASIIVLSFLAFCILCLLFTFFVSNYFGKEEETIINILFIYSSVPLSYIVKKMKVMIPQRLTPTLGCRSLWFSLFSFILNRPAAQTQFRFERVVDCSLLLFTIVILRSLDTGRIEREVYLLLVSAKCMSFLNFMRYHDCCYSAFKCLTVTYFHRLVVAKKPI